MILSSHCSKSPVSFPSKCFCACIFLLALPSLQNATQTPSVFNDFLYSCQVKLQSLFFFFLTGIPSHRAVELQRNLHFISPCKQPFLKGEQEEQITYIAFCRVFAFKPYSLLFPPGSSVEIYSDMKG